MRPILAAFVKKSWLRWLVATVILATGIIVIMTPDERAMVTMKTMSFIGGQH
jgi:hypothetical protein